MPLVFPDCWDGVPACSFEEALACAEEEEAVCPEVELWEAEEDALADEVEDELWDCAPEKLGGSALPGTCPGGDWGWVWLVLRGTPANSVACCAVMATALLRAAPRALETLCPADTDTVWPVATSVTLPGPPEKTAVLTWERRTFTPSSVPRTPRVARGVSNLKRLGSMVVTMPVRLRKTPTPSLHTAETVSGWAGS